MKRTLYLESYPNLGRYQWVVAPSGLRAIAPTPQAARALRVPHQSLETLAQESLLDKIRVAPALFAHRALRNAVSQVIETTDIVGTVRALTPALHSILRAGIDIDALFAIGSPRIQQLCAIASAYQAKLRETGFIDPTEVLWQASRLQPERQSILIYGYLHPRIDELAFLDAVAGDGSMMFLPAPDTIFIDNQETVKWLQQQGWKVEVSAQIPSTLGDQQQACLDSTTAPPGVRAHIYPNLEAEVRRVLAQVKSLLSEGAAANEIVLVARYDAFYGPTILDVAWEYNLPVRALYGVPFVTTRLGAWVQLLLEVIREKFPFEFTAKLLSHPLCSRLPAEVWSEALKLHPSDLWTWQSLGVDMSLLDWPQRDTRAEWVQRLQDILHKFDLCRRAGRWAREIVAFYKFQDSLVELAKPEAESLSLENFARDVIESLTLLTVPTQPGRGGVELHTPLSLFGASYQHVFVLGTAEGILPAPVQDDPVLDFHERKQLLRQGFRLEGAAQAARREAISFSALLQTATTTLTFSYPQLMGSEVCIKSPYLAQLGLEPVPPPPAPVASTEAARRIYLRRDGCLEDPILPHASHAWAVEQRRGGSEPPDEYDGVVGLPLDPTRRVFSASQLTALGQCPFKWFADKVLKLVEPEEADSDLNPLLRGNLYHRCLELVLKLLGTADLSQVSVEQLESAFLQAEQELKFPTLPAWNVRRAEHIKTLSRIIQQPDFLQPGAEIFALETEFEGEWCGLRVRGRVDRIDRTPQGLVLLDYKTSSRPPLGVKDELGKANVDIQLPLYIHVAQTTLFPGEQVDGAYYFLTEGKKLPKTRPSEETLQAIAQRVKAHLETGHYPVDPDIEQKACRSCAFDLVCRKGIRNSRKSGVV